jgi:predicted phosphodiesterase
MVKFQYISDIHLEFYKKIPKIKKVADNLCLLGDIGYANKKNYKQFINQCSNNYKNVFVIFGNHEFYNNKTNVAFKNCNDMNTIINTIPKHFPKNVFFLNNSCVYIDKITEQVTEEPPEGSNENYIKIVGSSLWSEIDYKISYMLNDFNQINFSKDIKLTPVIYKELFYYSKDYILNEINKNPQIQILLLTHHGTNNVCNGYYKNSPLKSCFVTQIDELYSCKNLIAAINGHSHSNINEKINGILYLSNCYGYKSEDKSIVKYNEDAVLEIN